MPQVGKTPLSPRDEAIRDRIKAILGMSVPKYIAIMYGKSQKSAQILFNQPESRDPDDEALLEQVYVATEDPEELLTHFISHILGGDDRVLQNIQTTIDSRFQRLEADNTVRSLSRPMLSDIPEVNQIELINDKYFYQALDMQREWAEAKKKQEQSNTPVRIPYTHEQIRQAFETVIDMCLLAINLRGTDAGERAREIKARAYALLAAAAIQMGRYDVVEHHLAIWRDQHELTRDPAVPLRVRSLLLQKELWLFKRKGEYDEGQVVAENQWQRLVAQESNARWIDLEPLACAGLELAALALRNDADDNAQAVQARANALRWLERFNQAPDRNEELGHYLQTDPELEPLRDQAHERPFADQWSQLMKKFGILLLVALVGAGALAGSVSGPEALDTVHTWMTQPFALLDGTQTLEAGANPGKIIYDLMRHLLGF